MKHLTRAALLAVFVSHIAGCGVPDEREAAPPTIDLQGHRGARGLAPENTIPSIVKAIDLGVTTLEMDVVLSADSNVVVSHEPWFSSQICSHPDGRAVEESEEEGLNLFTMTYEEIAKFDCGSRGHPDYPEQRAMAASKPLLKDVILTAETHADSMGRGPLFYNIEIKSSPTRDSVYYSSIAEFAGLVYQVIADETILDRTVIQSFDPRSIEAIRSIDSTTTLALLVDNDMGPKANLDRLSFTPDVYSPHHRLVNRALVDEMHRRNILVIPWTVNEVDRMQELIALGVDGLITDYPDRGMAVLKQSVRPTP